MDFEGKLSMLRFTSTMSLGGLGVVLPNGVYLCFNSTTCTSFMRYDNTNADLEITGGTAVTISGALTTGPLKIGSTGTSTSAFILDSESIDFASTPAGTCIDAATTHTGLTTASQAFWDFPTAWFNSQSSYFVARTTGTGTASVRHCCLDLVVACDPGVGTLQVRWFNN